MKAGAEPRNPLFVRGAGLFDRVDYRLIETPEERDALYLMRYRAYLHGGLIMPSESQRVTDRYDDAPNAWTFGIYVDGELCSSLRIHVLTPESRTSFATELFGDVLHPRLDRGEVIVDPARFVADPEKAQRFPELPYLTVRLAYLACEYFNADTGLAQVRAEHLAFYRRVFLQETIAEPRSFPNVLKKVALMACDFPAVRERVLTRFPIMRSSAFERRMLFDRPAERPFFPSAVVESFRRPSIVPNA
ncbi:MULTISPECIES: N-acyl amino acid synthase FeeM domain-containing protein [unclassified Bradyrhizobium]|uniref:N-acyl amino acid synthase FeeM domain-containing protein n=1 Tax=unclassified Bradyrhizobium TaxID=2631580 RepID=UPI002FF1905A